MQHIKEELNIKAGIKKFKNWIKFGDIHKICKKYDIKDYHINDDGTVDVYGNVDLWNEGLKEIPLKFGNVNGHFDCDRNNLTNLIGCPKRIGENIVCDRNNLTSLEGCPEYIGGSFFCPYNPNLWSFDYFPRHAKYVSLYNSPIEPIFDLFEDEYYADGGEFFSTSGTMMDFFWDMDPVYPGKIIMKWRMNKFLESLNKELTPFDIEVMKLRGWTIK